MTDFPSVDDAMKAQLVQMYLSLLDTADEIHTLGETIESTSYDEITPDIWKKIQLSTGSLHALENFVRYSIRAATPMLENQELIEKLGEHMRDPATPNPMAG